MFQELEEIRNCGVKNFRNVQVDESNILSWQGLIVPVSIKLMSLHDNKKKTFIDRTAAEQTLSSVFSQDCPPYDKGAFRIELNFPAEYPFKPPKVTFKTKIYHPNIDEKGQVCLPIISVENWKPATRTEQGEAACGLLFMKKLVHLRVLILHSFKLLHSQNKTQDVCPVRVVCMEP